GLRGGEIPCPTEQAAALDVVRPELALQVYRGGVGAVTCGFSGLLRGALADSQSPAALRLNRGVGREGGERPDKNDRRRHGAAVPAQLLTQDVERGIGLGGDRLARKVAPDVIAEVGRGLVPPRLVLLEGLGDDCFDIAAEDFTDGAQASGVLIADDAD